ncbi:chloride channel protein 2-like isoform X2 [Colossoma macropomum]|uniref:chloride channel protein 2-like isoform X2 n=1 Tax=Colossoma macropomum TaxID=42526 RepID=UPI001864A6E9|nr:chloride channel protein 2-like isoform X2 [Colossoma macropomum]
MTGDISEKSSLQCAQPLMYTEERENESFKQRLTEQKQSEESVRVCSPPWRKFFLWHLGEDWVLLILLGIIPATMSWAMDFGIEFFLHSTIWLYEKAHSNVFLQYLAWVSIPVVLISFAAGFTYLVGPQAAGSGIPEMKAIAKGVDVKDHLSLNTLVAKIVGLTCALGSGMPLGKESPFVHIGGICAAQLSRFAAFLGKVKQSESQTVELVISGCAVGLACCFGSPAGGVLYSVEVASTFFMVRNYWKGFFAASISAFVFRFLPVCSGSFETITPLFKTWFRQDHPYELMELLSFCVLGILSGLAGALFVFINGVMVRFIRSQRPISQFLVKTRVLYPALVTLVIATLTFPPGFGQFMAGELTQKETLYALFDNYTWSKHLQEEHFDPSDHSVAWKHPHVNVFGTLAISFIMKFFMSAVAISMPVPCGAFVPAFVIGAYLGRLVGEVAAVVLPEGIHHNGTIFTPVPGSYAVAGAAAMSGAATHTVSTALIVFELTGQINYIFPLILSVIVANIVAQTLQPSLYDCLIRIRKLPYPTELTWGHHEGPSIQVEDFMVKDVKYITLTSTYKDLHKILFARQFKSLPLVKSAESMILLGSIECVQLRALLSQHLSRARRLEYLRDCAQNERKHTSTPTSEDGNQKDIQEVSAGGFSTTHSFSSAPVKRPPVRGFQDSDITLKSLLCSHSIVEGLEDDADVEDTMTKKEILEWEEQQLEDKVNFNDCKIDPASIQLLERTSLQKVHSILTLMSLDQLYVTSVGKLIGVVSRRELRKAFEGSVKIRGPITHPPMSTFRESKTRCRNTNTPEATELHSLLGSESSLDQPAESEEK